MSNEKVINYPSGKGAGIFAVGMMIGFFTPSVFSMIIKYVVNEGIASGWLSEKIKSVISGDMTSGDAIGALTTAGGIIVVFYAIDKASNILKTLGIGFAVGLSMRVILSLVGVDIPFIEASYKVPKTAKS